ncbi:PIN domain-containing protein [Agromyces sp. LHK192]|uniref:PIN domain-containing protein n=1 Tax=Agromyces sp. LHK192 TaxID=2498704 RepID=UPI000FD77403|nr:PIN domain-containing protein [Agromyces sp. LHK192]
MKTIVLDATEVRRDWMQVGLTAQLLSHAIWQTLVTVVVPRSVLREVAGNYERERDALARDLEKLNSSRRRLGLTELSASDSKDSYESYLESRFDEVLGFDVAEWPAVSHEELVNRAVNRVPPFDHKGGGYRDSLVWASVVELARDGRDVVLASADRAFAGEDGVGLAKALAFEVGPLKGSVELTRDLASWLLGALPWRATTIKEAVLLARDEAFERYYYESDLQDQLWPDIEAFGFDRPPIEVEIEDVETELWRGRVEADSIDQELVVAQYDIGQRVRFSAVLPLGTRTDPDWDVSDDYGRIQVRGDLGLVLRVAVLFDADDGMSIESLSWRRSDGRGPGHGLMDRDQDTPLFDFTR